MKLKDFKTNYGGSSKMKMRTRRYLYLKQIKTSWHRVNTNFEDWVKSLNEIRIEALMRRIGEQELRISIINEQTEG